MHYQIECPLTDRCIRDLELKTDTGKAVYENIQDLTLQDKVGFQKKWMKK